MTMDSSTITNRRNFIKGGAAIGLGSLAGCVGGLGGSDSVSLSVTTTFTSEHYYQDAILQPFEETIVENADSEVSFEWYLGDELGPSGEHLQQVRNESADLMFDPLGYFSDELNVSVLPAAPSPITSGELGSKVMWDLIKPDGGIIYPLDYEPIGVRPLAALTTGPYQIWSVGGRFTSMSDWEGKAMRSLGGIHSVVIDELGGSPTEMPAPDVFSALERGTIDGLTFAVTVAPPWDVPEAANYATTNTALGISPSGMLINNDVYDGLPDDVQQAMDEAGEGISTGAGQYVDEERARVLDDISDQLELYEVSDEFNSAMQEAISPIVRDEAESMGHLDVFEEMQSQIEANQ